MLKLVLMVVEHTLDALALFNNVTNFCYLFIAEASDTGGLSMAVIIGVPVVVVVLLIIIIVLGICLFKR
jgi:hypothetical protein